MEQSYKFRQAIQQAAARFTDALAIAGLQK
jgi:hypothetical protein